MKAVLIFTFLVITISISAQNVGIDVIAPEGKLHIKQNSSINSPQLRLTEIEDDYARIKLESDLHPLAYWDIAGKADTTTELAHLNFYFKNLTNAGNRMTIRGNGNIGINNTNPLSKLDITNTGDGAELLRFSTDRPWVFKQTNAGYLAHLTLQPTIDGKIFDIVSPDGLNVTAAFKASNLNPQAFLVPGEGRVGVGTYNPNARMAVEGDPSVSENILRVNVNYDGATDLVGVDCDSYPATGYGVGGNFRGGYRGVRGISDAGNSTRQTIGVLGGGIGTNNIGTRVGLWGYAYGGATNWAGYFDSGNVYVNNDLRIGSGAINGAAGYKVAIDGKVIAEELRINLSGDWPDYVFDASYELMPLDKLESLINKNKHLPGIPSANDVQNNGLIVGEMQTKMMEKIEELTLYIIELDKELKRINNELSTLKANK